MQVNDRVTVKTDGGPRRSGVVLAIESFSEGTMYLVSLEDYPLGIWFFNEIGHPGNDSNLLIVFYVQIMPDDFVMQLHRF
ncbi:Protein DsrB [Klebsiella pneumoniae subsp. pneumoniae]|nr:Protein DsrB [Klebsiella pneumoniae subsp. pneumoniae]